ncbi:hypothetical protein BBO01nite_47730 [Brevibacillus borstelensis]|nr:hypothetical protein BBO01nite_47730 [Brevibacillus borstelensis]
MGIYDWAPKAGCVIAVHHIASQQLLAAMRHSPGVIEEGMRIGEKTVTGPN